MVVGSGVNEVSMQGRCICCVSDILLYYVEEIFGSENANSIVTTASCQPSLQFNTSSANFHHELRLD